METQCRLCYSTGHTGSDELPARAERCAMPATQEITQLLESWSAGDQAALDRMIPLVYGDLHRWARHFMAGERREHTLQATALVNEVYLRLIDFRGLTFHDRTHFIAICARLMRHILTDLAKARNRRKRGGKLERVTLESVAIGNRAGVDVCALDSALHALGTIDRRKSEVVELRFFGGLSVQETAKVLKVSEETVLRDWRLAKAWLTRELAESP